MKVLTATCDSHSELGRFIVFPLNEFAGIYVRGNDIKDWYGEMCKRGLGDLSFAWLEVDELVLAIALATQSPPIVRIDGLSAQEPDSNVQAAGR